jgi:hypothetical protein
MNEDLSNAIGLTFTEEQRNQFQGMHPNRMVMLYQHIVLLMHTMLAIM